MDYNANWFSYCEAEVMFMKQLLRLLSVMMSTVIVLGFPNTVKRYQVKNYKKKIDKLMFFIMALYLFLIVGITLGARMYDTEIKVNYKLFQCFEGLIKQIVYNVRFLYPQYHTYQYEVIINGLINIWLNILVFIPLGYLAPLCFSSINKAWKLLLVGIGTTVAIEVLQHITHRGFFDVDDLFLNTMGTMIGWILYKKILLNQSEDF